MTDINNLYTETNNLYGYDLLKDKQNQESISTNDYYNQKSKKINEDNVSKEDKIKNFLQKLNYSEANIHANMNIIRNQLRDLISDNDYVNIELLLHNVINEEKLIRKKNINTRTNNVEEDYFFKNIDKVILLEDAINDMMIKDDIPLQKTNEIFIKSVQNKNLNESDKIYCINKQVENILIQDSNPNTLVEFCNNLNDMDISESGKKYIIESTIKQLKTIDQGKCDEFIKQFNSNSNIGKLVYSVKDVELPEYDVKEVINDNKLSKIKKYGRIKDSIKSAMSKNDTAKVNNIIDTTMSSDLDKISKSLILNNTITNYLQKNDIQSAKSILEKGLNSNIRDAGKSLLVTDTIDLMLKSKKCSIEDIKDIQKIVLNSKGMSDELKDYVNSKINNVIDREENKKGKNLSIGDKTLVFQGCSTSNNTINSIITNKNNNSKDNSRW